MGSSESWVYLNPAGKLMMHVENDGHRYLRRGPEASDTEVTLEELRQYPRLYEEANELLTQAKKNDKNIIPFKGRYFEDQFYDDLVATIRGADVSQICSLLAAAHDTDVLDAIATQLREGVEYERTRT